MTTTTMPTMTTFMSRPALLLRWALVSLALFVAVGVQSTRADDADITRDAILNDPVAPVAGNPKGDLTIVSFFDYNCPFCKKSEPDLERLVKADGNIRLVYKDWPILTEDVHHWRAPRAGCKIPGQIRCGPSCPDGDSRTGIPAEQMREAIRASGVDMDRLDVDLSAHADEITALLRRNLAQAEVARPAGHAGLPYRAIQGYFRADYDSFKKPSLMPAPRHQVK